MELCIFTEPQQGASYGQLLAIAKAAEASGFDGFFRSDHYEKMGDADGLPGPTHAWVTLGGLARETSSIRLGTLVSPITFHDPGPLAIMVAQVDEMSGGRVDFGVGSGWYEQEHSSYGLPFPSVGERMSRFEEAVEQIVGLWTTPAGQTYNHAGQFSQIIDSPALPKSTQQPHPPIIIGGRGKKRTPALTAKYAAEFNLPFVPEEDATEVLTRVREACSAIDRDPDSLRMSAALAVAAGANDAEVAKRAKAIGREVAELSENGLCGTPDQILEKIERYRAVGVSRIYLQTLDMSDLEHVAFIGSEIRAHV